MTESDRPRVLVTGARGNIGRRCVPEWEKTMDLRLTDLVVPEGDARHAPADLTDFATVLRLMEGIDVVVHLAMAAVPERPPCFLPDEPDPDELLRLRVNTGTIYNVLEAARRCGVKRVVYMSSFTVYLGNKHRTRYDAATPLEPTNLYACTKLFGENLAGVYWRKHGLSVICLRLGQPFPIGHEFYDDLWKTNKRSRSIFVEMSDVARAVECAVRTEVGFGIYPIVSASDNLRVDLDAAREIGYIPRAYLSDAGLSRIDDGNFPAAGPVVTHNPGETI